VVTSCLGDGEVLWLSGKRGGANVGERDSSREGTGFYIAGWVQSRVHRDGRHWALWAASGDSVVSQFQGTRRWSQWRTGLVGKWWFSERLGAKRWVVRACRCVTVSGEGGVMSRARCHAGLGVERGAGAREHAAHSRRSGRLGGVGLARSGCTAR
jgi:hypothetical protein